MTKELTKGTMAKRRLPELLHSLSAWVGPPGAETGSEDSTERQTEGSLHFVERPVDRSVLWLPGGWGDQGTSRPYPNELFVEQGVLRDVETHALEEIEGSYGLLTGRLLACKRTRIPFVNVEASHRSDSPMPTGEDLASFREFFWEVREAAGRRGRVVVGWYHTHSLLGLQISERDRQIHVAHFHDEWPCALVVVTRKGASEGGFFQRDRGDILFRRSTRPFRELVNQQVKPGGGPYVTAVAWGNYRSHEPVLYARRPGDLPSKGGKWSLRQRPRMGSGSDQKVVDLAARASQEPAADESRADVLRPTTATPTGGAEFTYQRAMGRPVRDEDRVAESGRSDPAGPPPQEAWDEWKRGLGARQEREEEIRKMEAERAAAKADADPAARSKAALAARAAAAAAARAAAEALGIRSEGDAIADEAMAKAEADAEALVAAAKLAAKEGTPKRKVLRAKKEEVEEPEVEELEEVQEEIEEPVDVEAAAAEVDEETIAATMDEGEAAADVESEGFSEAEPEKLSVVDALSEGADGTEIEVLEPAMELGAEPEPEADVEETFVLEVAANKSDSVAAPPEEPRVGQTSKEHAGPEGVAARSLVHLADEGERVPVPFVLAGPPPRVRVRRYAVWVGIGLPLAAALAWLVFG
jgi:proteasome lid subunit RPN8/RPN11